MAYRIHEYVVRGEIDNTVKGTVKGTIWLQGQDRPLVLNLTGNCHPDIAGCRVAFSNPAPQEPVEKLGLAEDQSGEAGDMTASRRVRVPDVPIEEFYERRKKGETPPEHWGNCLYIEWYSARNGRVVIESTDYDVQVSEQLWQLTEAEIQQVQEQAMAAFGGFLKAVEEALPGPDDYPEVEDRPMNEFEWEQFMKRSDQRSERFGEVLEKFMDDPDSDEKIDEAMGWNLPNEAEEGPDVGFQDSGWDIDLDDIPDPVPNPETRGRFWIEGKNGRISHPLSNRVFEFGIDMSHVCRDEGFEADNRDEDVSEMTFKVHCTSAKLAGALNGLCYEELPLRDPGFIVAYLKRALVQLRDALNAHQRVVDKGLLPQYMDAWGEEMFAIRDDILALCEEFRQMGDG